jgi:pyridoxal 5'-phosphate synthase pdxT subunit
MKAGVLALQGDFREHAAAFRDLGVPVREVRTPEDLADVDCLAIPGGESTTMAKLAGSAELVDPIRDRIASGMPVLGTCAGMIVLSTSVDGDSGLLGAIDIAVRRNAYGRQTESFEADVDVRGTGNVRAVFIRAPIVESVGEGVAVLGEHEGRPVVLERDNVLVASFHPELVGETALHERLLEGI